MVDAVPPVALVTGGSRGIGASIATGLAADGFAVGLLHAREGSAVPLVDALEGEGRRVHARRCDVTDAGDVKEAVAEVEASLGPIGVLVNNAGIRADALFVRMKEDDWDRVVDVNLRGTFLCTRTVAPGMLRRRAGRIVNVVSVAGERGNPGQANYAASKGGVIALTRSNALEFAPRGVTVNAVSPGFVETEMTEGIPTSRRELICAHVPMGRFGRPEEVARAVRFLAGPGAGRITGEVLRIDGGLYL